MFAFYKNERVRQLPGWARATVGSVAISLLALILIWIGGMVWSIFIDPPTQSEYMSRALFEYYWLFGFWLLVSVVSWFYFYLEEDIEDLVMSQRRKKALAQDATVDGWSQWNYGETAVSDDGQASADDSADSSADRPARHSSRSSK